ncbi:MAG: hypothetical protein D6689_18385 [Deltaproteobacteria bacterium]|nr:MAG: hypothetical protein D6689_18385 [Deltaproteobacteria bacterium]
MLPAMRLCAIGLAAATAVIALAACPRAPARPRSPSAALDRDLAALAIPPRDDTATALARLDRLAESGHMRAAWERLHYLIDLFDDARFRRSDDSRALLVRALRFPDDAPTRGPRATDRAVAALLVEADRLLAAKRLHRGGQAARTLLEIDATPAQTGADLLRQVIALKRIAAGGGPLADNARLRLFGLCRTAFADAVRAPRPRRAAMIARCLYPLYDADPAPYFAADPRDRPPLPRWADLAERASALANQIAAGTGRLARAGRAVADQWRAFLADHERDLPAPLSPAALGLPHVDRAEPLGAERVFAFGDGRPVPDRDALASSVRAALAEDGTDAVAIALPGTARADALVDIAAALAAAGARRIDLAVAATRRLDAPPGDYWHGRTDHGRVDVVAVLPVSLALIATGARGRSDAGRRFDWDPRRATLQLHLVVTARTWSLVAPDGAIAAIDTSADPASALRRALERVRLAFPDEAGLAVVLGPDATYAATVAAIAAARHTADGRPLFRRIALAAAAPTPRRGGLAQRIDARASAAVDIEPPALAARVAAARRCYLDVVDRSPTAAGSVRVELRDGAPAAVAGAADPALRACAVDALAEAMRNQAIESAVVTFRRR